MKFDSELRDLVAACEADIRPRFRALEDVSERNLAKVLDAFRENRLSDTHFAWATGYGYDDAGREVTERIFAQVFGTEAALVRTQIVNGTHAIALCFSGLLRPGDKLLYCTGAPYDTLRSVVGIDAQKTATGTRADAPANGSDHDCDKALNQGSLADFGIGYAQADLLPDGGFDFAAIGAALEDPAVKMAGIQRATGYSERPAVTLGRVAEWIRFVRARRPDVILMADNCYGEFLEAMEPTDAALSGGVDIMAGSLIKNPGGGLALSGGYVAGRRPYVEQVAYRLTCPGIGGECGLTFGQTRTILQGLFLAPRTVTDAVKGAILCGRAFERLGYSVFPGTDDPRSDIVQTIRLGNAEALVCFCEGIMAASPVDSFVTPVPWAMPGYEDEVVMASGAFVTGSSIELSADGPLRPPYNVYFQGGLTYEHAKIGVLSALQRLKDRGLLPPLSL